MSMSKVTNRELFSAIALRLLPLSAVVAYLFRLARTEIGIVTSLPSFFYNALLYSSLLLVFWLTAGRVVRRLSDESKGREPTHGPEA